MSSKTKLLFVDDEGPIRCLFRRVMEQDESILLETASDGKEALNKLKTFHADIVINRYENAEKGWPIAVRGNQNTLSRHFRCDHHGPQFHRG